MSEAAFTTRYPGGMGPLGAAATESALSVRPSSPIRAESGLDEVLNFPRFKAYQRQTRPAELAITRVRGLRSYGPGWDGYGAAAALPSSVRDACEFLSRTNSDREFEATLGADGTISLKVGQGGDAVLLTFEGDGCISAGTRSAGFWDEVGVFPVRGALGETDPEIERIIGVR